jgi:peptide/nickel transport system ATP-binding protein
MIAMALACDPRVLIADEPVTALDVMVQAQVLDLLAELQRERRLTMIFITHDLAVLAYACRQLAVMYAGRIVEQGPSEEVFADPQHPYTRALAGAFPTIGDLADRHAPAGLGGDPPRPTALPTGCTFHPRCPDARPECASTDVELWPAGPGREAACVLAPGAPVRVP